MMIRFYQVLLLCVVALQSWPGSSGATPNPAAWRRETLLGANSAFFFVWVANWAQPGSHYQSSESAFIEKVRFADRRVVESHQVLGASVKYAFDEDVWESEYEELPEFDLTGFMRENRVSPAFSTDLHWLDWEVVIRDGELVLTEDGLSATILTGEEIADQIPEVGEGYEEPEVVGCQTVSPTGQETAKAMLFFLVQLNSAYWDDDWSEVLLLVPSEKVELARKSILKAREDAGAR